MMLKLAQLSSWRTQPAPEPHNKLPAYMDKIVPRRWKRAVIWARYSISDDDGFMDAWRYAFVFRTKGRLIAYARPCFWCDGRKKPGHKPCSCCADERHACGAAMRRE